MTDRDKLWAMTATELDAYLWRRLRREGALDPPLNQRFHLEPPEEFVYLAWKAAPDGSFADRLREVLAAHIARLVPLAANLANDAAVARQIGSCAILTELTGARSAKRDLFLLAAVLWEYYQGGLRRARKPLFHVLEALGVLRDDPMLEPFWKEIIDHADDSGLRAIAYYGLSKANVGAAMDILGRIMGDEEIDHIGVAWHLARETPGPMELGQAAARLPDHLRDRVRNSLEEAGADLALLRDFDTAVLEATNSLPEPASAKARQDPVADSRPNSLLARLERLLQEAGVDPATMRDLGSDFLENRESARVSVNVIGFRFQGTQPRDPRRAGLQPGFAPRQPPSEARAA